MTARKRDPQKFYNNMPLHFPFALSRIVTVKESSQCHALPSRAALQPPPRELAFSNAGLSRLASTGISLLALPVRAPGKEKVNRNSRTIKIRSTPCNQRRKQFSIRNKFGSLQIAVP
jgi:hypothetical protein